MEEELYYPSSENKGADQLRGYREADLRLCFRLCRLLVFPWGGSNYNARKYLSNLSLPDFNSFVCAVLVYHLGTDYANDIY